MSTLFSKIIWKVKSVQCMEVFTLCLLGKSPSIKSGRDSYFWNLKWGLGVGLITYLPWLLALNHCTYLPSYPAPIKASPSRGDLYGLFTQVIPISTLYSIDVSFIAQTHCVRDTYMCRLHVFYYGRSTLSGGNFPGSLFFVRFRTSNTADGLPPTPGHPEANGAVRAETQTQSRL